MERQIEKMRVEYGNTPLEEKDLSINPIEQVACWLKEALRAKIFEPNAMTLSTASVTGRPTSRVVLLKGIDKKGFIFFTNTDSRKGVQLAQNSQAALCFWFKEIYRQISIEGRVQKLQKKRAAAYFAMRPRGAKIAALASSQSAPLASRDLLESSYRELTKKYAKKQIPCPANFGGYLAIPDRIEFWQGRKNRLHDRFLYVRTNGQWLLTRLFP